MSKRLVKWIKKAAAKARSYRFGSARSWARWVQLLAGAAQVAQLIHELTGGGS